MNEKQVKLAGKVQLANKMIGSNTKWVNEANEKISGTHDPFKKFWFWGIRLTSKHDVRKWTKKRDKYQAKIDLIEPIKTPAKQVSPAKTTKTADKEAK